MNILLNEIEERIHGFDPSVFTMLDSEWQSLIGFRNYYRFLWAAVDVLKPAYAVEIGRERGVSANIMLNTLPLDSTLISIDIVEESIFLEGIDDPRLVLVTMDSCDAAEHIPDDINFLFIDGEHTKERVEREWALYSPKLAPYAVVVFDDIHFDDGMTEFWNWLPGEKYDISHWHERGFGVLFT